jgi:hypothetical protein
MKTMNFPFLGGRIKPDVLTENICHNLNLKLAVEETSSKKKAWNIAQQYLDQGTAVGLKLDAYHLDYFTSKIHFAGHYVAMFGYDDKYAYLVDTRQQGGKVKTTLKSLELARSEKGPMSSSNRTYVIRKNGQGYDLREAVKTAVSKNANEYLNPQIKNFSYKGILKTSSEIKKWFKRSHDIKGDFQTTALLMERAGTGGALFRNLYRDFLQESYELLQLAYLKLACDEFALIADQWTRVSQLFFQAGETQEIKYINEASDILVELSEQERKAMALLEKGEIS